MMSISAIVGSCNIAGVATAIVSGGPGALFWMVVAAFIGMAIKFSEIALGIKYREIRKDGTVDGGPMYYISKGLHCRWLGVFMSICVIFYAIVISGIIDINTMAAVLDERFSVPAVGTGVFFAILTGICIFGGAKRIGHVCEVLAPFMGGRLHSGRLAHYRAEYFSGSRRNRIDSGSGFYTSRCDWRRRGFHFYRHALWLCPRYLLQ